MVRCTLRGLHKKIKSSFKSRILLVAAVYCVFSIWRFYSDSSAEYSQLETKLPREVKFVLLWTPASFYPFYSFLPGQESVINSNCSETNCYFTDNKNFFGGDLSRFDAIAFNGRNSFKIPSTRYSHQKYILFNTESSDYFPVCKPKFDGLFNWTATYKLNSDIIFPYILVKDANGNVVGPKTDMQWKTSSNDNHDVENKIKNKTKAAAWFVSNCAARSRRNIFVKQLQIELNKYGLFVDIFGKCGPKKCPSNKQALCDDLVQKDYYFYLAFENSYSEDYVTEKVLIALNNYAVPVVYGGADYSRFLPPKSYLQARNPKSLAWTMNYMIENPEVYKEYFWWHSHYSFHLAKYWNICRVCQSLHNKTMFGTTSVYENFRSWWNPYYKMRCETKI